MKILTNEYLCNIPNFKKPAKGGPANFARLFFDYLKNDSPKHEWIGIILRDLDKKNTKLLIRKTKDQQAGRSIFKFSFPFSLTEKVLKAKKPILPEEILKKPIDYLSKFIKKASPDVVFLNGFSIGNWIILQAAHQANIPIVIQHAGIWTVELEIYKDFYSKGGVAIMNKMEKDSSSLATVEIFLNHHSQKTFIKKTLNNKPPSNKKAVIIPLPVDLNFFKKGRTEKKHFNFDKNIFNIGTIGRWDRIKNHEAIARLAALAKKENLPWAFHSITKIPDTKKNLAIKNLYRQNVNIIDHVPKEIIRNFCHEIDLLIIPSHFDVSPTTLLETIACDKPVAISSGVGFIDDYRKYKAHNWIINFNQPQKAIQQIDKIKNKPLPAILKSALLKKHEANFVFQQYLHIFNKITKNT